LIRLNPKIIYIGQSHVSNAGRSLVMRMETKVYACRYVVFSIAYANVKEKKENEIP
jgi:hypothetical protein